MSNTEQTLSIIKPDAVERNLIDEIKNIFIENNLHIKDSKKILQRFMRILVIRSNRCYDPRR